MKTCFFLRYSNFPFLNLQKGTEWKISYLLMKNSWKLKKLFQLVFFFVLTTATMT